MDARPVLYLVEAEVRIKTNRQTCLGKYKTNSIAIVYVPFTRFCITDNFVDKQKL